MSSNSPINFTLPDDAALDMGRRAQARRLAANLTRQTLAQQSGVPFSTLRRFEKTGQISLLALLQLADTLGCMDSFTQTFAPKPAVSLDEFAATPRKRGSR